MTTNGPVGSVAELWRFPVKSMTGERLEQAEIEVGGLVGDRAYALVEKETGKVVTAKSVRRFPGLMQCRGEFLAPPRAGHEPPPVRITLRDGTTVTSDDGDVDRELSAHFERDVALVRSAPDNYTIDQYHPDLEGVDPAGRRDTFVEQKLGAALFAEMGVDSAVAPGALFDLFPLTVLTTSTLDRLAELAPGSRFDTRRFRMNAIVATHDQGFIENGWVGHELELGDAVRLQVTMPDPRCVMTTLDQDDLPRDPEVLKTLVRHNRLSVGDLGAYPCAGVFAVIEAAGTVRVGDRVVLR